MIAILTIITIFYIIPQIICFTDIEDFQITKRLAICFIPMIAPKSNQLFKCIDLRGFTIVKYADGDIYIKIGNIDIDYVV